MKPGSAALTQGPIARTLLTFALPILLGNVLQSLNGSVNAIWVGKFLGEAALTATGNSNTVMFLMLAGVFGVSMAATILIAQYLGAQRLEKARSVVGTSASFFTIIAIVVSAGGFFVANRLLAAMHTPADALPYATAYLRIIFLAMPFLFLYTITMAVLRGAGDSRTPFVFLSISVALDIGLNPLFIFGLGPVPRLGIAGSALATLIANASTFLALLIHLYRRHHPLCIRRGEFALLRMDPTIVRTLIVKGTPMGLQMVVISTSAVAMISLVNRFGSETTAAYAAAFQLWSYIQMPAFAIGAAVSSMAAQNVGAHHWGRVARIARAGVLFNFLVTGSVVALICIFNRHMLSLFLPTTGAAIEIAQHINYVAAWSFIFFGISMVLFAVVRATGAVTAPLLILFVSMWLVRFPLAAAMLETWKADAIWWSFPLSSGIAATLAVLYYKYGGWRSARMTPRPGIPETSVQLP